MTAVPLLHAVSVIHLQGPIRRYSVCHVADEQVTTLWTRVTCGKCVARVESEQRGRR